MKACCARYAAALVAPNTAARTASLASRSRAQFLSYNLGRRTMSSTPARYGDLPKELPGDDPDDVLFNSLYGVRTIELNRPKKLNSLNGSMARKILPRLREWEKSQIANIVMISGAGPKAFCAGGDVAELANQNRQGPEGQKKSSDYFALEYKLDHLIATYSKPYIAVMDGITMGGGVGLSVHAPFRIATEKTVFAMPETTIGFFPDVGGSFFLPRLDGEIGTYLALTSERLHGVQAFYAGIATHYLDSSVLAQLTTRLSELVFPDTASLMDRLQLINSTISEFVSTLPSPHSYEAAKYGDLTGSLREAIDRTFKYDTVEEILSALRRESESSDQKIADWAQATQKTISLRSPTSLRVTLRQLREGRHWNITETFIREHKIATKFMAHPDFVEGVTARLINKPPTKPQWKPATLEEVSKEAVDEFFADSSEEEALTLVDPYPGALDQHYTEYPHAVFSLPREIDIQGVVRSYGRQGSKRVIEEVLKKWNHKAGVREKVEEVLARKTISADGKAISWKSKDANL
ncbi:3-hydroxyisobutyryl-CoA hydrolase [Exophiala dermatitidis]|uniref:3-hydroxyisobutyryl-CoA hydrolase n=2 Tax=Exophiala dermatitidis TaxID=5970 RepID=H6BSS6_EXODN|nr:mitochondrial 3-hydroxyisobutyryl-CoA hydrolase [Exophiala dermatitidis NIH/UT8656]KAJ4505826.1 3-hydroxyisobutyryl-CoA hydrolase [Exophiala dermatitidis]EHY54230.1 mitochondrial 3-hydroxyisobutyryl-CoA hydrolase [Exophiala dermatitidis NIH/UT8656]KAJ4507965.1 3-hydroxyisobutyryl-CoA hydrolase [Exophiala dermatitidis]KAJ4513624.1 3-hydroxyisobutyryl-CoA hydrolase [Exophiala dermatitidis]KAJ4535530.1 3-hydroxyisobutyryl-CoA hydrolase [Exophiala dermatitidis]